MRNDQAEEVIRLVEKKRAFRERISAEARSAAQALIQRDIGPDHKVLDLDGFYAGLWQALKSAREQGQADCLAELT